MKEVEQEEKKEPRAPRAIFRGVAVKAENLDEIWTIVNSDTGGHYNKEAWRNTIDRLKAKEAHRQALSDKVLANTADLAAMKKEIAGLTQQFNDLARKIEEKKKKAYALAKETGATKMQLAAANREKKKAGTEAERLIWQIINIPDSSDTPPSYAEVARKAAAEQPKPRPLQKRDKRTLPREEAATARTDEDKDERDNAILAEEEETKERGGRGRVIETERGTRAMIGAVYRFFRGNATASRK